jgi:hypothetical protein
MDSALTAILTRATSPNTEDAKLLKPPTLSSVDTEVLLKLCDNTYQKYQTWQRDRYYRAREWVKLDELIGGYPPKKNESEFIVSSQANTPDSKEILEPVESSIRTRSTAAYASRENFVTQIIGSLFPQGQEFVAINPVSGVEPSQALALQQLCREYFSLINFKTAIIPVIRALGTYGISIFSYEWIEEKDVSWEKITGKDGEAPSYNKKSKTRYYAGKVVPLNIHEVVYDTTDTDLTRAMIIRKKTVYGSDLLDNPNYAESKIKWDSGASNGIDTEVLAEQSLLMREPISLYKALCDKPAVDVYEAWGDFIFNNKMYKNYVLEFCYSPAVTSADEKELSSKIVPIRLEPNPYKTYQRPYYIVKLTDEVGSMYPKSPLEHSLSQHEAIVELQQDVKNLTKAASNRPFLVQGGLIRPASLKELEKPLTHNQVIYLKDGVDPRTVFSRMQDDSQFSIAPAISLMEMFKDQARLATGETESMTGGSAPQYMKTGVALAYQQGANNRYNLYASTIEADLIVPVIRQTIDYFSQFLKKGSKIVTLRGSIPITEDPAFTEIDAKISVAGASHTATQQLEANNLMQTMQMIVGGPLADTLGVGVVLRLFKTLLAKLNVPYVDDIVPESLIQTEEIIPRVSLFDRIKGAFYRPISQQQPQQQQVQSPVTPGQVQ